MNTTLAQVITIGINIIQSVAKAISEASTGKLTPDEALAHIAEATKQDQAVDAKVDAAVDAKFPTTPVLFLAALLAFGMPAPAQAQSTREVLVLTTATTITFSARMTAFEIINRGPNSIWCAFNGTPVSTKSKEVATGGIWAGPIPGSGAVIKCLSSANQVTGAATVVNESATQ